MKVIFTTSEAAQAPVGRELTGEELAVMRKIHALTGRISIYGFPVVMGVWLYFTFPNFFPADSNFASFCIKMAAVIILVPFLHELIHLIAIPSRLFHRQTAIYLCRNGLKSHFAVRVGGALTREQGIWIALLPFLALTVLPFGLVLCGVPLDFAIGIGAAGNFALSTQDIAIAIGRFMYYASGQKIQES